MDNSLGILRPIWAVISKLDLVLLVALAILLTLGGVTLYSASGENIIMMERHFIHLIIATIVMIVMAQIPSHILSQWSVWIYAGGVILLVLVIFQGSIGGGAQRWLEIGAFRFQPSEVMKLAVPMMVASYLASKPLPPKFKHNLVAAILVLVPMLLIAKQPDLGTSLLIGSAGFFVIYFAGIAWKWLLTIFAALSVAAPLLFFFGMQEYQRQRVLTLLDPGSDKLGAGYQIIQSTIAIGTGGVYGKGWLNGDQSRLDFLPERHTDFIFAIFGEEFGLLGNLILLSVYIFIIWRGLYLASCGGDTFSRLLGGSLSMTFFVYLLVNTGMVSGILPVVGVPLPLISYGGTSMVTLMAAFGLLMGLKKRKIGYDDY
ncbi:MAG: rod shape-determining protein RodA [Proteobacteria bacterium]|nr:MAG: rod shape-determining protein RodA [Pseudomonadota bacterium]